MKSISLTTSLMAMAVLTTSTLSFAAEPSPFTSCSSMYATNAERMKIRSSLSADGSPELLESMGTEVLVCTLLTFGVPAPFVICNGILVGTHGAISILQNIQKVKNDRLDRIYKAATVCAETGKCDDKLLLKFTKKVSRKADKTVDAATVSKMMIANDADPKFCLKNIRHSGALVPVPVSRLAKNMADLMNGSEVEALTPSDTHVDSRL